MNNQQSEIETTQTAVEAARARVESIRQAIIGGDEIISQAELADAKSELEFCELREQARIEREKKQFDADRRARLLDLQKQLDALSDTSRIESLLPKIGDAVKKYLTAAQERNSKLSQIRDEISAGGFVPGSNVGKPIDDIPAEAGRILSIGTITATEFNAKERLNDLISGMLSSFSPRRR